MSAIDVIGCACEGRVGHYVYRKRGRISRLNDAMDGKRRTQLIAAVFDFVSEELTTMYSLTKIERLVFFGYSSQAFTVTWGEALCRCIGGIY